MKFWAPLLAWMGFISYCSSIPASSIPPLFPYQDVVYHFCAYLALALLFGRAILGQGRELTFPRFVFFVLMFGTLYGIIDEFHQSFVPGRSSTLFDASVDALGSLVGGLFYRWQR